MGNTQPAPVPQKDRLINLTLTACDVAKAAAEAVAMAIGAPSTDVSQVVRKHEEQLDTFDRIINEEVTSGIIGVSEREARELLACLKFIIELERIGDLLLNVANRLDTVATRLEESDTPDLSRMATLVCEMLAIVHDAFASRDVRRAIEVLKKDEELDRLRNMVFIRHIEKPSSEPRQESFHIVFIAQGLERAGDHAKNLAEEICHLVSGRSVRHILREFDRPVEQVYLERMKKNNLNKI
jgi:phosphate transport system protein